MGSIGVFAINPALYKDLGCYPLKDYDLLSVAVRTPNAPDHLTAALFWQKTGTTGIHVPYEGGSAAHLDLIAGNADVSFQNLGSITQHVKAGKMKLLAVTVSARGPSMPNVPTLAEAACRASRCTRGRPSWRPGGCRRT